MPVTLEPQEVEFIIALLKQVSTPALNPESEAVVRVSKSIYAKLTTQPEVP